MAYSEMTVSQLGNFSVVAVAGGYYKLRLHTANLAVCVSGDWLKTHGGIEQWIEKIRKRSIKRIHKIDSIREELDREYDDLDELVEEIKEIRYI